MITSINTEQPQFQISNLRSIFFLHLEKYNFQRIFYYGYKVIMEVQRSIKNKMRNKKILIVDDELDICLLLTGYLKRQGFDASYATTLKEALETANKLKPGVVFLDHNLPDGLGISTIPQFKSVASSSIYVISAMGNLKGEALKNGADDFFEKPLSLAKINEALIGR